MKTFFALPIVAAAALGLAACTDKSADEVGEAANAVAADGANALDQAGDDLEAATNSALSGAENSMDSIGDAADDAATATGNALEKAGKDIKDETN